MSQPMQQQQPFVHDLKGVCEKSASPCQRDTTEVKVMTRNFETLSITRCCSMSDRCGQLFVRQESTGHEMPLHVLDRADADTADLCFQAFREALRREGRGAAAISLCGAAQKKIYTIHL